MAIFYELQDWKLKLSIFKTDSFFPFHCTRNDGIEVGFESREGWQRKSFVEGNATKIVAHSPTEFRTDCLVPRNDLNEGTPK